MENRRPETPAAIAGRKPLLWVLVLACAVLVILAFLQLSARLFAPGGDGGDAVPGRETVGQTAPATQAPALDRSGTVERQGAMIVDDPATYETRAALAAIASAGSEGGADAPAADAAAPAAGARRTARPAARTPARRDAQAAAAPVATETDLISTLMRIIKQGGASNAQHESMDALIAQVQAENDRTRSQTTAALAPLGGGQAAPAQPARSPLVQEKLRACPKANTVEGIECRSRICAQHAGEDAACPRR